MLGKTKRFVGLLILLLLISRLSAFSGGSADATGTSRPSVVSSGQQAQKDAALSDTYWTPARMKAAHPVDTPVSTEKLTKQAVHATSSGSAKPVAPTTPPRGIKSSAYSPVVTQNAVSVPSQANTSLLTAIQQPLLLTEIPSMTVTATVPLIVPPMGWRLSVSLVI
jgi:hypothetical protein